MVKKKTKKHKKKVSIVDKFDKIISGDEKALSLEISKKIKKPLKQIIEFFMEMGYKVKEKELEMEENDNSNDSYY